MFVLTVLCASGIYSYPLTGQAKKLFTVADEIGLTFFGGGEGNWDGSGVGFSPDGNYVAVDTERRRVHLNSVEDSLRLYRAQDIERFLAQPRGAQPPSPIWVFTPPMRKEGSVIEGWRWLPDSSGVAYLERSEAGNMRLKATPEPHGRTGHREGPHVWQCPAQT